ncbi:type II toxin-antitoxin system RelE/ParE family toxin [Candidatus Binatia bacterium]|nr:type II toxin-antitoxin system RelE/ParE family toxin [Candidatus Binatia bacterium]
MDDRRPAKDRRAHGTHQPATTAVSPTVVRPTLDAIIADPSVGKALRDELAGLRSCRIGRCRLVYRVAGSIVEIVAVGPRASIDEETWRRVRRDLSSR